MLVVASAWIGKPSPVIDIVTSVAGELPPMWLIPVTLPTLTPAIRTGEARCSSVWDV